jgi:hypothetical protein
MRETVFVLGDLRRRRAASLCLTAPAVSGRYEVVRAAM